MARSTFEGPILSGDNRFGPQRDVGYSLLSQTIYLDFSNSTPNTANYGGASGIFVTSNNIPNSVATIYAPQAGSYNTTGPAVTSNLPTADATGTNYRGAVFLLPQASIIQNIFIDNILQPTDGTHAVTAIQPYVSNDFATTTGVYGTSASITGSSIGRTTATFSTTQYDNINGTLQDVQNIQPGNQPTWFSQLVVGLKLTVASLTSVNAGQIAITVQYLQTDPNIGNGTTYPYGNFD